MGMVIQEIEVRPRQTESVGEYVWSFMTFRVPDTSIWLVNVFLTNYLAATNLIEIKSRLD